MIVDLINDEYLNKYIAKFSWQLARKFPHSTEVEDVMQDMWEKIISRIDTYDGDIPIIKFCKNLIFSNYGFLFKKYNKSIPTDDIESNINDHEASTYDRQFEIVEASVSLDQIEKTLKSHSKFSRKLAIAADYISQHRDGKTIDEIANDLGLSRVYVRYSFQFACDWIKSKL